MNNVTRVSRFISLSVELSRRKSLCIAWVRSKRHFVSLGGRPTESFSRAGRICTCDLPLHEGALLLRYSTILPFRAEKDTLFQDRHGAFSHLPGVTPV